MKDMKEMIADNLGSRYIRKEVSEIIDKCCFLDPRFKNESVLDSDNTTASLLLEAEKIMEAVGTQPPASTEAPPPPKKSKGLGPILHEY